MCKDSQHENTCKLKTKETRAGNKSRVSIWVLQEVLITLALTGIKL